MLHKAEIIKGIEYLSKIQNEDGGIPGLKTGDSSACWTTAETLEVTLRASCLSVEYHKFILNMIDFLLDAQIDEPDMFGAWPEYSDADSARTFATGHALSALKLSESIIINDSELHKRIGDAINKGFEYLKKAQNPDGGWGITSEGGGEEQKSRAFSTIYVLHGYIQNGYTVSNEEIVRKACQYLEGLIDKRTGGFTSKLKCSDVCYTARIINILIKSGHRTSKDSIIKKMLNFVFKNRSLKTFFKVEKEIFATQDHAGYHNNTPIDVTETLCLCGIFDRKIIHLEKWFMLTQEEFGGWYLGIDHNPKNNNEEIITWATNDAIYALLCIDEAFTTTYYVKMRNKIKYYGKIIFSLIIFLIVLVLFHGFIPTFSVLDAFWNEVSEVIRKLFGITIIVGILINFLSDLIKKFGHYLLSDILHWVN